MVVAVTNTCRLFFNNNKGATEQTQDEGRRMLLTPGEVLAGGLRVIGSRIGKGQFSEVYPAEFVDGSGNQDQGQSKEIQNIKKHIAIKIEPSAKTLKSEVAVWIVIFLNLILIIFVKLEI